MNVQFETSSRMIFSYKMSYGSLSYQASPINSVSWSRQTEINDFRAWISKLPVSRTISNCIQSCYVRNRSSQFLSFSLFPPLSVWLVSSIIVKDVETVEKFRTDGTMRLLANRLLREIAQEELSKQNMFWWTHL